MRQPRVVANTTTDPKELSEVRQEINRSNIKRLEESWGEFLGPETTTEKERLLKRAQKELAKHPRDLDIMTGAVVGPNEERAWYDEAPRACPVCACTERVTAYHVMRCAGEKTTGIQTSGWNDAQRLYRWPPAANKGTAAWENYEAWRDAGRECRDAWRSTRRERGREQGGTQD